MSIVERKKDEIYRFRTQFKGMKYEETFYGTKKEATQNHSDWVTAIKQGKFDNFEQGKTVKDMYDLYTKSRGLEASTIQTYNSVISHIPEDFMKKEVSKVNKMMVQKTFNDLKCTYSQNVVHYTHKILKQIFNYAIELDIIESNPCNFKVSKAKGKNNKFVELLSLDDVNIFLAIVAKIDMPKYQIIYLIGIGCGLRISEILGLQKEDIDTTNHTISINKQYKRIFDKNNHIIKGLGTPKTDSSVRTLNIPKFIRTQVYEYLLTLPAGSYIVQGDTDDKPLNYNCVYKHLTRLCKREGIKRLTPHDLRKLYATLMAYSGNNMISISSSLGHTSTATTEKYLRSLSQMDKQGIDNLDLFIKNGLKKRQT